MAYLINNIKSSPFEGLDYSYMTSKFGYRKFWNDVTEVYNTNFHNGVDLTSGTVVIAVENLPYPIVAKHHFGSRGNGNYLLNSQQELQAWMKGKDLSNYLFEKFYNYVREYRLHVSANGCFYTCRKMLKSDIPKEDRWFRNDSNSVWVLEENPLFDRPANWTKIVEESVKALKATGLDFGACDVRVQSSKTEKGKKREEIDFIIVEINSAPSFGDITAEKYLQELPKIAHLKKNK